MPSLAVLRLAGIGLAILALLGALAGFIHHENEAVAAPLRLQAQAAQAQADQAGADLTEQARRGLRIQEAQDAELLRRQAAEAAARRATAAVSGLSGELAATKAAFAADAFAADAAASAAGRASAAQAITVLADMLGQCSERRRELASYADAAAGAGQACEQSYDALTPPKLEPKP